MLISHNLNIKITLVFIYAAIKWLWRHNRSSSAFHGISGPILHTIILRISKRHCSFKKNIWWNEIVCRGYKKDHITLYVILNKQFRMYTIGSINPGMKIDYLAFLFERCYWKQIEIRNFRIYNLLFFVGSIQTTRPQR